MKTKTKQRLIETEDKLADWRFISIYFILAFIVAALGGQFLVFTDTATYKQGFQDGQANCSIQKEVWVIEKPIDLKTNIVIGATAHKINNTDIICEMFNEGCK